jgi:hypothetical protein
LFIFIGLRALLCGKILIPNELSAESSIQTSYEQELLRK